MSDDPMSILAFLPQSARTQLTMERLALMKEIAELRARVDAMHQAQLLPALDRGELAELRAYRDRTEKALRELCRLVNNGKDGPVDASGYHVVVAYINSGVKRVRDMVREDMDRYGLWRDGEDGAK